MTIDTSKLKVLKLITGEELIGHLVQETLDYYEFYKPIKVQLVPDVESGTVSLAFLRYFTLGETEWIKFNRSSVVTLVNPTSEGKEHYVTGIRTELMNWIEEESGKVKAQKDFEELEAIANDDGGPKQKDETPDDEKNINHEAGEEIKGMKHRKRTKKKDWLN